MKTIDSTNKSKLDQSLTNIYYKFMDTFNSATLLDPDAYDPPLSLEESIGTIEATNTIISEQEVARVKQEELLRRSEQYGRLVYCFNQLTTQDFESLIETLGEIYTIIETHSTISRQDLWQKSRACIRESDFGDDINPLKVASYLQQHKVALLQCMHTAITTNVPYRKRRNKKKSR